MTSKTKAIWAAVLAATAEYASWLSTIPPDAQTGIFEQVEALFPPGWRAQAGAVLRLIAKAAAIYSAYHAAHSGPQTPPANPPQ